MSDSGESRGERFPADRELVEGIVRTSPVGITVVDGDGTVTFANERAEKIYGRPREEIHESAHDDPRWDLVDEDGEPLDDGEAPFDRVVDGGEAIYDQVLGLRRPSGERVWISVNGAPQWDEDGELERAVFAFEDVTERRRRERELREKERRYHAVFEDPNILVGLLEPDGTVVDINQTAMEYIDADLEAVTGEPFWETPWWGEGEEIRAEVREWTARAAAGEYVDFEADLARPDGEPYTISGYFRPVTDDDGEVVSIIVSDRDVTERKRSERELEASERRYRTLVENFPNGAVALVDEDIRYRTVGGSPTDTADVTAEEAEGTRVAEAVPPSLAEDLVPAYEAAFDGETTTFESQSGDRIYQFQVVPVRDDDGEIAAALGMSQDITERRESERRYQTLVENFPNGAVALFDDSLRYTVAGGAILDEIDASEDEIVGQTVWERYPEELAAQLEPNFRAALDGETNTFEVEFHDRHWLAYTLPVENDAGDVFAGMMMVQDITERKRRERELERALDLLEKTERIADVAGWEVDPETREPFWSDHLFELLDVEYDEQPTLEQALDVYHSEADREIVEDAVATALETGESFDVEARFPRPSGDVGWLRVQGDPEVEDGEVVSLRGAVQDVTERKEREQALQESRNQLRALIDVLPVAVFVAEADGQIVEWNDAAEEIWGGEVVESESVAEYDRYEAWWVESGEPVEPDEWPLARALEGEEVTDPDEIRIKGFDGEYRTVLNHGMPVRNADGEVTRAVVTLVDITERKEYQRRLEESNERLEQFAYAASHDLQEPLRMVSSYLQLIEDRYGDDLDEDGREFLEFAVDGAERMRAMIDALLEYSRVETGGEPFEPVDLNAVVADVRDDLQVKIEERDADVAVADLPRVEGDASQLRQVFQNLLENALEYSGDEPPTVRVAAEPVRGGSEWRVSVEDEGVGIDPEDQDRIFEVFQRLHGGDEQPGTGIGLALCERIVERHGGEIRVESEPGEGTTFSVTLPAAGDSDR